MTDVPDAQDTTHRERSPMPERPDLDAVLRRLAQLEHAHAALTDTCRQLRAEHDDVVARLKAVERATPLKRPKSQPPRSRLRPA
jgi:hypothetical protein